MIQRIGLGALAALLFCIVATANSGGYRYGVSDQAFYLPAIEKSLDSSLFPRDSEVLAVQMRAWLGDTAIAGIAKATGVSLPDLAITLYLIGLLLLGGAIVYFIRGLGGSWWAVTAALTVASLRHRIPRTGANSLEGYFHPRMIAFAIGLWALGLVLRRRFVPAFAVLAIAAAVHPTTALWFGAAVSIAAAWEIDRRSIWAGGALLVVAGIWLGSSGARMDDPWLAVIAEKDYLFPLSWPWWAWAINLTYPLVALAVYGRRLGSQRTVAGETGLLAGLLMLFAGFVVSIPLTALHVATAVQLQVTRVLWLLDAAVLMYLAWWLLDDVLATAGARRRAVALAILVGLTVSRGYYVLAIDSNRPLVTGSLPADDWTDAMRFLRSQRNNMYVLADPGHAWRYGSSVRVAAARDTVLEQVKDSAMATYDRSLALRIAGRQAVLDGFADFSEMQMREAASRLGADILVVENDRQFSFPVLFQNNRFVVYALR